MKSTTPYSSPASTTSSVNTVTQWVIDGPSASTLRAAWLLPMETLELSDARHKIDGMTNMVSSYTLVT